MSAEFLAGKPSACNCDEGYLCPLPACQEQAAADERYWMAYFKGTPKPYTADEIRDAYDVGDPKRYAMLKEIDDE